jgi:RND family efflux transporter MFP subunit
MALAALCGLSACKPQPGGGPAGGTGSGGAPAVQVSVAEARRQPVVETLSLVGTLAADEMIEVKSETDGTVMAIRFQEGQAVKQGDVLVRLDETKSAASLAQAEANLKLSEATYQRNQQLLDDKLISQQEFDQAAATYTFNLRVVDWMKRQLKDAQIHAPFSGVVSSRLVSPGQVITKNTTLTWLVDLDPMKVEVSVPERFLGQLRPGQNLELTVAAFPERKFTGRVFFVAPFVEPATRTALVKASIPNPDGELKPGMFANLDLALTVRAQALVLPEAALAQLLEGGQARVLTVTATNTVQFRVVKLGVRTAGLVEVAAGLQPGERVVVEGAQKVGPGSAVKPVAAEWPSAPAVMAALPSAGASNGTNSPKAPN